MKTKIVFLLTLVLKIYGSEIDTQPELQYRERINYINISQFNANIEHLLSQGENNKRIAECLIYLTNQMDDLKFYLNGINSTLKAVTIDTTKNTTDIQKIIHNMKIDNE